MIGTPRGKGYGRFFLLAGGYYHKVYNSEKVNPPIVIGAPTLSIVDTSEIYPSESGINLGFGLESDKFQMSFVYRQATTPLLYYNKPEDLIYNQSFYFNVAFFF